MPTPTQPDPSGASMSGTKPSSGTPSSRTLRTRTKVDYNDLHTGASQFGSEDPEQALQCESQSQKYKKCLSLNFSANFKKPFIILCCILKMTQGQSLPESDLEAVAEEVLDSVISGTPGKQCLKIDNKQCWSLKIKSRLIQHDVQPS
jgi:hypothetical protein